MTREDIIRMAREAGFHSHHNPDLYDCMVASDKSIERFATLVADAEAKRIYDEGMVTVGHMREAVLAEREACAKVCDARYMGDNNREDMEAMRCAAAIRARGKAT